MKQFFEANTTEFEGSRSEVVEQWERCWGAAIDALGSGNVVRGAVVTLPEGGPAPGSRGVVKLLLVLWVSFVMASMVSAASAAEREWMIDGIAREALVYVPSNVNSKGCPVVFAFHGHGGNMRNAARLFHYEKLWPEAIVVYMQGLKTPGRLTDPNGAQPGWQRGQGDQGDRDLKFFDAVLAGLKRDARVDPKRIYVTGHSNGGGFTYLLWAARGDQLAAVAPSGAAAGGLMRLLKPKALLHVAGETDPLVRFEWQKQTINAVRELNQCGAGESCGPWCTQYSSRIGAPLMTYVHPGGHEFPAGALRLIVKFFKEHPGS